MNMVETIVRAIARANGDEFADAFKSKDRWVAKRGLSGGRFRDVNEPFQSDYTDMAIAALKAMREPTPVMIDRFVSRALQVSIHSEGGWSDYARNQWQAMIDGALSGEREGKGE